MDITYRADKTAKSDKTVQTDRKKALDAAIAQIEKQHGKGSIMRLGENKKVVVDTISTGFITLDNALGVGGIPRGRVIEIYGNESSGKTTLALHIAAEAQKKSGIVGFIDAEHAMDPVYTKKLGVNINDLLISQPDTGEDALEICDILVRSNTMDLIIIDSVAALVPKAEIEGEMGDSQMALQARLMSKALRKLTGSISKTKTAVIFINQLRANVGGYGSPDVTTGGRALKFYASVRIEVKRLMGNSVIKVENVTVGNGTSIRVVKNKVAPPFRETQIDLIYGQGLSRESDLLDCAVNFKVVDKSGSWYSYNDQRIGQGKEKVKQYFQDNPQIMQEIDSKVRKLLKIDGSDEAEESKGGEEKSKKADTVKTSDTDDDANKNKDKKAAA